MNIRQHVIFLPLLLSAIGFCGLILGIAWHVAVNAKGGNMTIVRELMLPEGLAMLGLLLIIFAYGYLRLKKGISELIGEAMDSVASGILFFDAAGLLARYNWVAAAMVPQLTSETGRMTYKQFLAHVYDHSLDIQDETSFHVERDKIGSSARLLFREIIRLENGAIVLAQFYQRAQSGIIIIMTDVSLLRRHIDEMPLLTDENHVLVKALEASGNGLAIARIAGTAQPVQFSNEAFAKLFGMRPQNIIGRSLMEIFAADFSDQIEAIKLGIEKAKREGRAENIWLRRQHDKKTVLWFSFNLIYFVDTHENQFIVCFGSNRTQARLEEARLQQSQKLETVVQLAGGIAHDFNNVLSVVDGYCKLMQKNLSRGEDIAQFFDPIARSVKRGTEITGRLLTFGQCRTSRKSRVDLSEHIRGLEAFLMPLLKSSVNLVMSVQDDPAYTDASPDAITQALLSLVANAQESMPDGGDLVVSLSEAARSQLYGLEKGGHVEDAYYCLQVIDSGEGISPSDIERVYEPFYTTKDATRHSGLGLSLVYGVVRESDGLMEVRSTPGLGTSVSIFLPKRDRPQGLFRKSDHDDSILEPHPLLSGKTILIVDDSADIREMEACLLTEAGMSVLTAYDYPNALTVADAHAGKIDFILIDVVLPGKSGIELRKTFSTMRPESKIVFISAYPALSAENLDSLKRDGMQVPVLAKPLIYKELVQVLTSGSPSDKGWETGR